LIQEKPPFGAVFLLLREATFQGATLIDPATVIPAKAGIQCVGLIVV